MTTYQEASSLEQPSDILANINLCLYATHSAKQGTVIDFNKLTEMVKKPIKKRARDNSQKGIKAIKSALPLITPFVNSKTKGKTKDDALEADYSCIVIDFDHEKDRTIESVAKFLCDELGYWGQYLVFTTSSHSLNGERAFKIIIPLAKSCDVEKYTALSQGIVLLLDTDPAQARKTQGFYAPCDLLEPSVYDGFHITGDYTCLNINSSLWQKAIQRYEQDIEKQQNDLQTCFTIKPKKYDLVLSSQNIIGLINQSYDLTNLLESAGHKKVGEKWLSPFSSSGMAGGLIFQDKNGKQGFYSHSSSCPLGADANGGHGLDVTDVLAITRYDGDYPKMIREEANKLDAEGQKKRQQEYAEQNKQFSSQMSITENDWKDPIQIKTELRAVKSLTPEMLPIDLNTYCRDEARRADNMTPDLIAVCLLTSLGSLIGARVGIKPKQLDDYLLVPNLWGGIVAPPSSKKSPAIKAGTRHLDRLVLKAKDVYQSAKQETIAKALVFKSTEKTLNKNLDTAKTEQEKLSIAQQIVDMQTEAISEPILKRYFTNDSSPEALAELERGNPNGILVIRDELVGWLSSLVQNDADTGRAFYLEGWNGTGSYQFDRIMRGSGFIENHCLSILGGIQPDKLISYLEKTINGHGNDGLLQRFQLLIFPDLYEWEYVDQTVNKEAREAVFSLFESIDNLTEHELVRLGAKPTDDFNSRPYFRFTDEAQEIYKKWSQHINGKIIPSEDHPIIQEHLTKYGKLMPSLALIFHLIECVQTGVYLGGISKKSAEMAIEWCEYLESHARRIYGLVLQSSMLKACELAKKLKRLKADEQWRLQGFTAREVHRKNWKSLTEIEAVNDALDILTENHWLSVQEIESTSKGGRPTKHYRINPKIFIYY